MHLQNVQVSEGSSVYIKSRKLNIIPGSDHGLLGGFLVVLGGCVVVVVVVRRGLRGNRQPQLLKSINGFLVVGRLVDGTSLMCRF